MTASEVAQAFGVPERTAREWLAHWHTAGVAGVERVPGRGRYGSVYRVDPSVVRRWFDCELPAPRAAA